jgi:K+-transporting ATPase KdpF subunit
LGFAICMPGPVKDFKMPNLIGIIIGLLLIGYLFFTILRPEKF